METPRVHKNADHLTGTGRDRDTIEIIPNGINIDRIRNASLPDEGDSFDVLFAGRLVTDKNVPVLLGTFNRVTDDYDDMTLDAVSDDPEANHLERQADSLDHANRVSLLRFLDEYEDILGRMRAADVFTSPSPRDS